MSLPRHRYLYRALLACFALSPWSCANLGSPLPPAPGTPRGPIVSTPAGDLEGRREGTLRVFKGIPYASPPVGEARWRAPTNMPRWTDVRQAKDFGPACIQPTPGDSGIYSNDLRPTSEDCLTLNIWTPADAFRAPVFVWIHGGALLGGSSKEAMYDGARLAAHGIVVVSINYRLGVLGYLAHPELSAESPARHLGQLRSARSDRGAALDQAQHRRVRRRPVQGDHCGRIGRGLERDVPMASPDARGLFSKAIAQSAYMISTPELSRTASARRPRRKPARSSRPHCTQPMSRRCGRWTRRR